MKTPILWECEMISSSANVKPKTNRLGLGMRKMMKMKIKMKRTYLRVFDCLNFGEWVNEWGNDYLAMREEKSKEGCGLFCFWLSFFQIKLFVWMLGLYFLIFLGWFKRCSFKVYILGPTQHLFLILHSYPRDICVFISLIYLNPIYVCVFIFFQ